MAATFRQKPAPMEEIATPIHTKMGPAAFDAYSELRCNFCSYQTYTYTYERVLKGIAKSATAAMRKHVRGHHRENYYEFGCIIEEEPDLASLSL